MILFATPRLIVERLAPRHAAAMADYQGRNADRFAAWEPLRDEGYHSEAAWAARAADAERLAEDDRALATVGRIEGGEGIATVATLSNIVRGAFQAAHLGFSCDGPAEGQGLMREHLEGLIVHAFGRMGLHRLMANHLPTNDRSARLLGRLGFEVEGLARDYLLIAGVWQDHVLRSKIAP